ncbi:MAG: endonuclease V [Sedimentisphaerales bacterium]|nr:endonuclease V [Sedimentisphaerales bacterium]
MPGYGRLSVSEAIRLQKRLARRVRQEAFTGPIRVIAGADAAFSPDGRWCLAAVVAMSWPQMVPLTQAQAACRLDFPYIPGLLSFREAPAVIAAAGRLPLRPDVLLIDGQGWAHPRRFGLACHVGVELGWPAIGCAKSRLIGTHRPVGQRRGCCCRLLDGGQLIGKVLRTRDGVKCLYVSVGHRIELDQAVRIVLRAASGCRLPEPARRAHQAVTKLRHKVPMDSDLVPW